MELLAVARTLWRRRVLIAAGALVAALAAILTTHSIVSLLPPKLASRQQVVGVAQSRLFVDTARSQITGATAPGADTIVTRASLAANLLTSPDAHRALARDAGVPVGSFEVIGPAAVTPTVNTELAQRTSLAAAAPRAPYALAIETDSVLPIVAIHVTGPDAGPARRLARAVDDRLAAALAPTDGEPARYVVESLEPVRSWHRVTGPRRSYAAAVFLVLFAAWCGVLALVPDRRRATRRARRRAPSPA